jgi:uncharacterized protein YecT (DUF1311 family)
MKELRLMRATMVIAFFLAAVLPAFAGDDKPTAADRTAVADCLTLTRQNLDNASSSDAEAKAGAAARLERAAKEATSSAASCIGVIAEPCQSEPGGASNLGTAQCYDRETAVWDERLNQNYKQRLDDAEPAYRDALKKMQRAWIAYRDAKCGSISVGEQGSISVPLTASCLLDETARQAIFLEPE